MTEVYLDTIAYLESRSGADAIATFTHPELYTLCAPIIEKWVAEQGDYVLTESCDLNIKIDDGDRANDRCRPGMKKCSEMPS